MLITPSFKKSLIVEQFQGNYDNLIILSVIGVKVLLSFTVQKIINNYSFSASVHRD